MKLEEVLKSQEIKIYESEKKEDKGIINNERYNEIVKIANDVGVIELFRKSHLEFSHQLYFFHNLNKLTKKNEDLDLYENHVNNFNWSGDDDKKYSSYLHHWLNLCEGAKREKYISLIRCELDEAFSYVPSQKEINEQLLENRRSMISNAMIFDQSKRKIEKAKKKAVKEPTKKEMEEVSRHLYKFKLSNAFEKAARLYSISNSIEDLSVVIRLYNSLSEFETHHSIFTDNSLETIFKTSRKNAVREEYVNRLLKDAEDDFFVGSSFDRLTDLFLLTKLPEDKELVDKLMERGISLLKKRKSTNFGNFTDRFFDLYKFTRDEKYINNFKSLEIEVNGERKHPYFIPKVVNINTTFPVFIATKNPKYIPELESHCSLLIKKKHYRSAENVYFEIFKATNNKDYLNKAREMFEIIKEEGSEEKPIISLEGLFGIIDKSIKTTNESQKVFYEEATSQKIPEESEEFSIMPTREKMNEIEVSSRIMQNTRTLLKYLKHDNNKKDLDELRKNISLLDELNGFPTNFGYLFDLYQLSGDNKDLTEIENKFKKYVSVEHHITEHENLLKELAYDNEFAKLRD